MDSVRAAFLRAICETPDDDAPRLIYADWLDEHGDPERAEFTRLQVGIANGEYGHDPNHLAHSRERDLLTAHQKRWWAELPRVKGLNWAKKPKFRRGFVHSLHVTSAKAWLEHAGTVCSASPVDEVSFGSRLTPLTAQDVLDSHLLGRLASLPLTGSQLGPLTFPSFMLCHHR